MPVIPSNLGRGYYLAFAALFFGTIMAVIAMLKQPNQFPMIMEWWQTLVLYLIGPIVAVKELGKVGTGIVNKLSQPSKKPEAGENK